MTVLAKDNGHYCAKCPELDLVTELPTADATLEDLIEAIRDYAKEYLKIAIDIYKPQQKPPCPISRPLPLARPVGVADDRDQHGLVHV